MTTNSGIGWPYPAPSDNQGIIWWPVVNPSPVYVYYPQTDPQLVKLLERLTALLEELTKMLESRNHTLPRDKP